MKKVSVTLAAMITVLIFMSLTSGVYAKTRGTALVVHGTTDGILEGDLSVADKIASYSFDVDVMLAADCDENTWKNYDMIFIGESVISTDVGTKFTSADCVVIVSEPGNYDEMLIGNYDPQYDSENVYNKGKYIVKNDIMGFGLLSFQGFSSEAVAPGFFLEWGEGGTVIVENENGSPAVTIFSPGSKLFDGSSAINYRIQWFFRGQDAAYATEDTWKMFESVINYVIPLPVEEETVPETFAENNIDKAEALTAVQTFDAGFVLCLISAAASLCILKIKKHI